MEAQDWIELSMRAFFCFTGIIGNGLLGLRSLPKSRSQLRTSDILFVNLAVSNLITNCLVDLPETMAHFAKTWLTSKEYCGVTQFSHEISETSSIFSTMFISMYWHQKLVGSIRRGGAPVQMDNLRLVGVLLAGSWTVATGFSLPHIFIGEHDGNESLEVCEERFPSPAAKQTFDGMYLTLANVVPIVGITYATVQIVVTLLRSQKRVKDRSSGTNPPPSSVDQRLEGTGERSMESFSERSPISNKITTHQPAAPKTQVRSNPSSGNQVRAAKSVAAVAMIFIICWFTHLVLRIYSSFRNSVLAVKLTNFIGASYVCFVPYVYLHGVKKLNCSCWRKTTEMEIQDWIESSIRAFFCLTGITGNFWLGLRSLPKSRSQLRPNDILFINLAVSNLITNCMVDLPDTLAQFVNTWFMGKNYCGVLQFSSDLSETSSIFSTMFISMYWHQKLVGSIRRGGAPVQMDNWRLVTVLLAGSWIVALMFSVPHFFIAEHDGNETLEVCEERFPTPAEKRTFDALYLILANVVPLVGITYASVQIVLTLLQSQKRIMDHSKGANNAPPEASNSGTQAAASKSKVVNNTTNPQQKTQVRSNPSSGNQVRAAKSVVAVAMIFIICWFTHLVLRIYSSFRNSVLAVKLTNFIGASYTCFVPYVYLHGVKKLNCSCW